MNKIVERFEKLMLSSMLISLLDVIVGIIFLKFTDFTTRINIIILGSLILVHGLFFIIRYVYDGLGNKFFAIDLIMGVVSVILGGFTILNPFGGALTVIGILFCIWLVVNGLEKLYYGYRFMKAQEDIYPLTCFISILMMIMGILTAINPFKTFMLITRLVGIFLICSGVFDAMINLLFRQRAKNILKIFN